MKNSKKSKTEKSEKALPMVEQLRLQSLKKKLENYDRVTMKANDEFLNDTLVGREMLPSSKR